jgi:hypothetical protein
MKIGSAEKLRKIPLKPPNRKHGKFFKNSTQFFSIKLEKKSFNHLPRKRMLLKTSSKK